MGGDCGAPSPRHTGEATVAVKIMVVGATGNASLKQNNVPRGTRLLLVCDVEELTEGNVINYTWYHSSRSAGRTAIRKGDDYYTAMNDTLLVDAISWGDGTRRHICEVQYFTEEGRSGTQSGFTNDISLTG